MSFVRTINGHYVTRGRGDGAIGLGSLKVVSEWCFGSVWLMFISVGLYRVCFECFKVNDCSDLETYQQCFFLSLSLFLFLSFCLSFFLSLSFYFFPSLFLFPSLNLVGDGR